MGEGFPGGKEEDLHRLFISGKGGEGSRISSTVGRKIRYRFPSSKLSTRYVWEGRQGTPYGIRGTRPASLVHVPSYVGGNFGRSLASCARTTRCSTTRMHAPRSHRDTHRDGNRNRNRNRIEDVWAFGERVQLCSSMWDDALARSLILQLFVRNSRIRRFLNR